MDVRRLMIVAGLLLVIGGIAWPWLSRLGLGRLPGDISIHRQNFGVYFPVVSCLLVSAILTLLFWLLRK
ncbi:MAG TPA: DUF2905 domain-containing protein [Rhizomicrobium sp.]|jgi:hypothetical protein